MDTRSEQRTKEHNWSLFREWIQLFWLFERKPKDAVRVGFFDTFDTFRTETIVREWIKLNLPDDATDSWSGEQNVDWKQIKIKMLITIIFN